MFHSVLPQVASSRQQMTTSDLKMFNTLARGCAMRQRARSKAGWDALGFGFIGVGFVQLKTFF